MDPRANPYAPGAGAKPPELAGRDAIIEAAAIAIDRIRGGLSARGMMFYGLRGVGKTVLLNRIRLDAESRGIVTAQLETPENRSLPAILAPALRSALLGLSRVQAVRDRFLGLLAAFSKALKVKYADVELSVDVAPVTGVADSGDLERDIGDLLIEIGRAARDAGTAFAIFVDELQYVAEDQFGSLIAAVHRIVQEDLPVVLFGAGLPQLLGRAGRAKSYSERLFEFVEIDKLGQDAAREALTAPAQAKNVSYADGAIDDVYRETLGYPYFIQEWGKRCWDLAEVSPIGPEVARQATPLAVAALDASFFRVRYDRCTPLEKQYLRAMAELGPGPSYRSGEVADLLKRAISQVAPVRQSLIAKGMVYSPAHGDVAFTVPQFDGFMRRTMKLASQ
jgi:hypothetical protein